MERSISRRGCFCWIAAAWLGGASNAWANNPPGPFEALPTIFLLPLMALLSWVGGYYVLRRVQADGNTRRTWLGPVSAAFLVLISSIHEGIGMLLTLGFSGLAIGRAVTMIRWGTRTRCEPNTAELTKLGLRRLLSSGIALLVISIFLGAMPIAFRNDSLEDSWEHNQGLSLDFYTAYQRGYAQWAKEKTGIVSFDQRRPDEAGFGTYWTNTAFSSRWGIIDPKYGPREPEINEWSSDGAGPTTEFGPEGKTITVRFNPRARFRPFFPFSLLSWDPAWRVDESGKIWFSRRGLIYSSKPVETEYFPSNVRADMARSWKDWLTTHPPTQSK